MTPEGDGGRSRTQVIRGALGAALCCLAALIIWNAVVVETLDNHPSFSLSVAPHDPRALAGAADDALMAARTRTDLARTQDLASQALAQAPTAVDALRDLGLIRAWRGDVRGAYALLSLAGASSRLDSQSHFWLMKYHLAQADYKAAFADADALLRHEPGLLPKVSPIVAAYLSPSAQALASQLDTSPPWRTAFLAALAREVEDPARLLVILVDLEGGPAKPRSEELAAFFDRRIADGAYQAAYLDWLQLLTPTALERVTIPYDGNFEGLPGEPPFNWRLGAGLGGQADRSQAPGPTGQSALHVHYDNYGAPDLATQLLVLTPGDYRLSGQVRGMDAAANALEWVISCAEAPGIPLAQVSPKPSSEDWQGFNIAFTIPETHCEGQWLKLVPHPGDHQRDMDLWFRGLSIARLELHAIS